MCYTWWTLAATQLAAPVVGSALPDIFDLKALEQFVHVCMGAQGPGWHGVVATEKSFEVANPATNFD